MRYNYKYITVKLSRSSSLAVINSAAVGSWMLWQFLLAWLENLNRLVTDLSKRFRSSSDLLATESFSSLSKRGLLDQLSLGKLDFDIQPLYPTFTGDIAALLLLLVEHLMDGGELRGIYHWQGPDQLSELQIAKVLSEVGTQDVTRSTMTDDSKHPCWNEMLMLWNEVDVLLPHYPAVWVFGILHEGVHREHLIPVRHLWGHWSSNNLTPTKTLQSCWSGIGCLEINTIFSIDSYKLQGRLKAMSSIQSWSIGFSWNFALGR